MTDMHRSAPQRPFRLVWVWLRCLTSVEEVAGMVLDPRFQKQADHINGATIVLDGGLTAGFGFHANVLAWGGLNSVFLGSRELCRRTGLMSTGPRSASGATPAS